MTGGNEMQNNSEKFSVDEGMHIANSPAGQALFAFLQQSDPNALNRAMEQAAAGNYERVQEILSVLAKDENVKQLLSQLGGQIHG